MNAVLRLALRYGGILAVSVAVAGSVVGFLVDGVSGLASALLGAGMAATFMGLTALSIAVADRVTRNRPGSSAFFGVVMGAWVAKLVAFAVAALLLRDQSWVSPYVFFFTTLVVVAGSLLADGFALARARVPYVGDIPLPGDPPVRD